MCVYDYGRMPFSLCPHGHQDLTIQNADDYVSLVEDFCLNTGIRRQLDAFKRKNFSLALILARIKKGNFVILSGHYR